MSDKAAPVDEPTIEQMENVMLAMGMPVLPEGIRPPHYRESLLNFHRLVVRMLNGDEEAEQALSRFRAAFGTRERSGA